ncbi:MAG: cation:proton antiporter, partial [Anaerolineae bacterium]|nr:cation:proton antiporter [Anaerolineae bacterium]
GLPGWAAALVTLSAIAFVVLAGSYAVRPLFRFVHAARLREMDTIVALFIVVGIASLMSFVGLSPALGTFLAGVMLASSEFKHELESQVEPFKGLLLGLFFITVGAGIDFGILFGDFATIIGLTLGVIAVKGVVLYALAQLFRLQGAHRWLFTLGLAQAGEFGFVLLSFSLQNNVIPADLAGTLSLVVALSMLLTPGLFILYDRFVLSRPPDTGDQPGEQIGESGTVIIAGSGRFGQIVNRLLVASGVKTVVLDHEVAMIDMLGKFGVKSYYGDASRPDLLHAAGIESAKAIVIAIDDKERAVEMVEHVKRHHPDVTTLARAYDVGHLYLLNKAGVDIAVRELFDASLEIGKEALKAVGTHPFKVEKMSQAFRRHDFAGLDTLYEVWDADTAMSSNKAYLARAREHGATLRELMETDRLQLHDRSERGWTPPPKHYAEKLAD